MLWYISSFASGLGVLVQTSTYPGNEASDMSPGGALALASERAGAAASSGEPPKPPTAAKETQTAKRKAEQAAIRRQRDACANTLVYVLKCKYDINFVNAARMLCLATLAECHADHHYRKHVLSKEQTVDFWADYATGSWLSQLREAVKTTQDLVALERCGFITSPAAATNLDLESAEVAIQDALAQQYLSLLGSVLRHRGSSLEWHTSCFPGVLAGLLHKDPTKQQQALTAFKAGVESVAWNEGGCAEARQMASRSMLKSALMRWATAQGHAAEFRNITALFRDFLEDMYGGGLQTVINENYNKIIRDLEERQSTSKVQSRMSRWHAIFNMTSLRIPAGRISSRVTQKLASGATSTWTNCSSPRQRCRVTCPWKTSYMTTSGRRGRPTRSNDRLLSIT